MILALIDGSGMQAPGLFVVLTLILLLILTFCALDGNRYILTDDELIVEGPIIKRRVGLREISSIRHYDSFGFITVRANGRYFAGFSSSWFYGLTEMLHLIQERTQCSVSPSLQRQLSNYRYLLAEQKKVFNSSDSANETPNRPY